MWRRCDPVDCTYPSFPRTPTPIPIYTRAVCAPLLNCLRCATTSNKNPCHRSLRRARGNFFRLYSIIRLPVAHQLFPQFSEEITSFPGHANPQSRNRPANQNTIVQNLRSLVGARVSATVKLFPLNHKLQHGRKANAGRI